MLYTYTLCVLLLVQFNFAPFRKRDSIIHYRGIWEDRPALSRWNLVAWSVVIGLGRNSEAAKVRKICAFYVCIFCATVPLSW